MRPITVEVVGDQDRWSLGVSYFVYADRTKRYLNMHFAKWKISLAWEQKK